MKTLMTIALAGFASVALASTHESQTHLATGNFSSAPSSYLLASGPDDRRDRREERGRSDERQDRRDCRQEEGRVGDDKRECKQEEVRDGVKGNQDDGDEAGIEDDKGNDQAENG